MKSLKSLLDKKNISRNGQTEIDEKSVENIFFRVLEKDLSNLSRADFQNFKFSSGNIFLRAVHPAIAAEIWRKKEKLKKRINEFLESDAVENIRIK